MTQTSGSHAAFSRLALSALTAGACCIGFSAIFVRWSPVGPIATAVYRLALPLPVLMLLAWREPAADAAPISTRMWLWLLVPGLCFAGDISLWHYSIRYTTVANATLLGNGSPIFVTLVAWSVLHERISGRFVAGLIVALLGAFLLMGESLNLGRAHFFGDLFAVGSAVFYAGYQLAIKRLRNRFSTVTLMLATSVVSCVPLLALLALLGERFDWRGGMGLAAGLGALFGLAYFCHLGGQGLIVYGMKRLPAAFSSVTLLVQPVVTTIAGWALLGERLGLRQLLGGLVVMAGIVLAQRSGVREESG